MYWSSSQLLRSARIAFRNGQRAAEAGIRLRALQLIAEPFQNRGDYRLVPGFIAARADAQRYYRVDCFSISQTSRMISSVRSTGTLISTIADINFSPRMSSRSVPVLTSVISDVIGFFFSKCTPAGQRGDRHSEYR